MSEVELRFEGSMTGVRFGGVLTSLPMLLKEGLASAANGLRNSKFCSLKASAYFVLCQGV